MSGLRFAYLGRAACLFFILLSVHDLGIHVSKVHTLRTESVCNGRGKKGGDGEGERGTGKREGYFGGGEGK
jgi:hypothetical protein